MKSYEDVKKIRIQRIRNVSMDHQQLNELHDEVMKGVIELALEKVNNEWGPPPAHFAFFLMGSAGRFEQGIWSDQDHGLIFDGGVEQQSYFLQLGEEIAKGLAICQYELCEGRVMANNSLWCKSLKGWENQLIQWLEEATWSSLRNFSIFFDSRVLIGEKSLLKKLKEKSLSIISEEAHLYFRLLDNVGKMPKAIGVFGQFLVEPYGEEAGSIHLKNAIFFPYVNALRLLAIKEQITKPSTISRLQELQIKYEKLTIYEKDFEELLRLRLKYLKYCKNYRESHFIKETHLTKKEKRELKRIAKNGTELFNFVKVLLLKRG